MLYQRILPVEDLFIPLMNVHHRNPYPESDVNCIDLYRIYQQDTFINYTR